MLVPILLSVLSNVVFLDELSPLYRDATPRDGKTSWTSHTALGLPTGVHVLGDLPADVPVSLSLVDSDGQPVEGFAVYRLHDVPVEENTGLDSRTEQFKGTVNPHVIRRAPFRIYEALEPLDLVNGEITMERESAPMAIRVEVEPNRPGTRDCQLKVTCGELAYELPWTIHVHDWRPGDDLDFGYTNWFSPTEMAQRHDVTAWSEEHWPILAAYAALMDRGGQDTFWMRWSDFFVKDGERWRLESDRLDRYLRTFFDAGLTRIEGAPIANRPGGDWSKEWLQLRLAKVPATGEDGQRHLADMAGQLRSFMAERGWENRWIQHLADEPTDVNAGDYARLSKQVRELLPGVPIIEATMTRELVGSVDIWCPQVHRYQENRAFFEERQAAGDEVWTYTCLVPGGPWLNRLMDQERLRSVYFAWAAARFGVQGFLHWGLNHYKADPFQQSVVDHPAMPGTTNKLPAGDTHVVFPGPGGPWSSTRFEAQRIGMEDLAALRVLQQSDPERCEALVDRVFRGYDDWEPDVEAYRAVRRDLLRAVAEAERPTP